MRTWPAFALTCLAACGTPAAPATPATPAAPAAADPAAAPAAVADAPDDPAPSAALLAAPPWRFRYAAAGRTETWTLRWAGGDALLDVETDAGTARYQGTAADGEALAIAVTAGTAAIALRCERVQRAYGAACNDAAAPPLEVLDCYHPDYQAPMPFAPAPGVEYVDDAGCTGYRLIAP